MSKIITGGDVLANIVGLDERWSMT